MRKIIYTSKYGAGWTSWHSGSRESTIFMLEYRPIVHFLEKGGNFTEKDCQNPESNRILKVFLEDFHNTFPNEEPPCLLGLTAAQVMEVEGLVRITEHDGKETVEEVYDDSIL